MPQIHFDVKPFDAFVHPKFIGDEHSVELRQVKVIGVSSYPGHVLTFIVLVDNKYLFFYVPASGLFFTKDIKTITSLYCESYNCYFNCPSGDLSVVSVSYLQNKNLSLFTRDKVYFGSGKYMMSFDWYNDNDCGHLINYEGRFIIHPNHKFVVEENSAITELPKFGKLKDNFIKGK